MSKNNRAKTDLRRLSRKFNVELPDESNMFEFVVDFKGPENTAYHGGLWKVNVCLPPNYPYKSPSIGFSNRIFHPNVDEMSGSICMDVINQTWTPMFDLINVFEVFLPQLLLYPNPSSPLNGDAASMLIHNERKYDEKIREMVQRYARDPDFTEPGVSGGLPCPMEVEMKVGGREKEAAEVSPSDLSQDRTTVATSMSVGDADTPPDPAMIPQELMSSIPMTRVKSLDDDPTEADLIFWDKLSEVSDMSDDDDVY